MGRWLRFSSAGLEVSPSPGEVEEGRHEEQDEERYVQKGWTGKFADRTAEKAFQEWYIGRLVSKELSHNITVGLLQISLIVLPLSAICFSNGDRFAGTYTLLYGLFELFLNSAMRVVGRGSFHVHTLLRAIFSARATNGIGLVTAQVLFVSDAIGRAGVLVLWVLALNLLTGVDPVQVSTFWIARLFCMNVCFFLLMLISTGELNAFELPLFSNDPSPPPRSRFFVGLFSWMQLVTTVSAFLLKRQTELQQRTEFIGVRRAMESNSMTVEVSRENAEMKKDAAKMQKLLTAAKDKIRRVLSENMETKDLLRSYAIPFHDLNFGSERNQIGEGAFGSVFKARLRGTTDVAVKIMRVCEINEEVLRKFRSELIIMAPLSHMNILHVFGGVWDEGVDKLCIVLEYCNHGSMEAFLHDNAGTWLGFRHIIALGIGQGLSYLHNDLAEPLIHRDVKPENILIGTDLVAKLADFGTSIHLCTVRSASLKAKTLRAGTRLYCAPEVIAGDSFTESADTFSFALVLLGLAVGDGTYVRREYAPKSSSTLVYALGWRPRIPEELKATCGELTELIEDMWNSKYRERPSMREVVTRLERCKSVGLCKSQLETTFHVANS